ncbi:chaplin family protein [Streptomyces sp. NPDC046197]|uniref:chaplin family protein n=1 Tax=Streptomyces sp. NPDC046197 TaxID=3154337 RepID=UPI0033EE25B4
MSLIAKAGVVALGTGAVALTAAGLATANAGAEALATDSSGVASGNVVQVPVHVPVNVCHNTLHVFGALNPSLGHLCRGE